MPLVDVIGTVTGLSGRPCPRVCANRSAYKPILCTKGFTEWSPISSIPARRCALYVQDSILPIFKPQTMP